MTSIISFLPNQRRTKRKASISLIAFLILQKIFNDLLSLKILLFLFVTFLFSINIAEGQGLNSNTVNQVRKRPSSERNFKKDVVKSYNSDPQKKNGNKSILKQLEVYFTNDPRQIEEAFYYIKLYENSNQRKVVSDSDYCSYEEELNCDLDKLAFMIPLSKLLKEIEKE